ncbi:hypothetical protein [Paenibacillus sp. HW567]|uniref:hypothetical protein n=1 Tax=Paenibacillus sp. HW567 TaxID=1034769 RepID=UPI00036C4817|nr:hypothetical protein [Paenibacillus sp. HW567]
MNWRFIWLSFAVLAVIVASKVSFVHSASVQTTDYIVINCPGTTETQKAYVYNKGRLKTEIWPDQWEPSQEK